MNILLILLLPIISIISVSLLRKNILLVKYLPISINIFSLLIVLGFMYVCFHIEVRIGVFSVVVDGLWVQPAI